MVPEAIFKKLEPMFYGQLQKHACKVLSNVTKYWC